MNDTKHPRLARAHAQFKALRIALVLTHPFYGVLSSRFDVRFSGTYPYPMATDGRMLVVSLPWWEKATVSQRRSVLMHEVEHVARGHVWRRGQRDVRLWNEAADHNVNLALCAFREFDPSIGGLCDPEFEGMAVERIYTILADRRAKQQQQQPDEESGDGGQEQDDAADAGAEGGGDAGGDDEPEGEGEQESDPSSGGTGQDRQGDGAPRDGEDADAPSDDGAPQNPSPGALGNGPGALIEPNADADGREDERDWQEAVLQAERAAREAGTDAGHAMALVSMVKRGHVPYRDLLQQWLASRVSEDYTWRRVNTRHMGRGFLLPSLHNEAMGKLLVVRDTSGSICDATLAEFNGETETVIDAVRPSSLVVIDCDTRVRNVTEIARGEPMPEALNEAHGRGGTSFIPPFLWLREQDDAQEYAGVIYLTDMYGTFPPPDIVDVPVLWVSVSPHDEHATPPVGEVAYMYPEG